MLEEDAVAGTKVIEAWLAVGCLEEPQTRAFAVTSLEPLTLATLTWKSLFLQSAEAILFCAKASKIFTKCILEVSNDSLFHFHTHQGL